MTTLLWIAICLGIALVSYWIGYRLGRKDVREEFEAQGFIED